MCRSVDEKARGVPKHHDRAQSRRTSRYQETWLALRRAFTMAAVLIGIPAVARAQISVSPSYDAIGSTGPNPYTLIIENDGSRSTTALLQASCTGAVTSCSVSTSSVFVGASGGQQPVTVSYTTAGNATGSFTLTATDRLTQQAAQATVNVTMPNAHPSVTANMSTAYTAENFNTSGLAFTITNTGNTAAQYTLTPNCGGNVSGCSVSSPTGSLSHNQSATVSVNFTPGAATAGNGTISLTATGPASLGSQASTSPTVTVVPLSEAVQVTPDGDTLALTANDTVVVPFKVHETGNAGTGFNYALTASCSGSIVGCTLVSTGTQTMTVPPAPGVDQTVQVRLIGTSNFAGGYGAVSIIASYNNGVNPAYQDEGSYGTTIPDTRSYTPTVMPKGDSVSFEANTPSSVSFAVKNTGNTQATYTLSQPTACTGQATETSCVIRAADLDPTVNPGASDTVHVDFTTGPPNQRAHIYLQAQATAGLQPSDAGSWLVVAIAPTVQVTAPTPTTTLTNTTASLQFHVKNTGTSGTIAYHLQVTGCTAPLVTTGCTVPDSIIVAQGADSIVTVQVHAQATTGTAQVMLRASKHAYNTWADSATTSVTVSSRLVVAADSMSNLNQDIGLCAYSCFAVTAVRSTTPYYTLDAARNVTLAYNSDRAFPRPFVYADVRMLAPPPTGTTTYRLQVKHKGTDIPFANGETILVFQNDGANGRLAAQLDLLSDTTQIDSVSIVVTAIYSDSTTDAVTVPAKLLIVNTGKSASIAKGWTIAGVPQIHLQADSSVIITDGTGSAQVFTYSNGTYTSPIGDFTTLANQPGGGWVHTALDGTSVYFRSDGLADRITDRLGSTTSFEYDTSNRLWKIHDPMLSKTSLGHDATILTYGATGLSTIQEPNPVATSGRVTSVHVGPDSLLSAIVDPDGDSTAYGYDSHKRLSTVTGRDSATVTYNYGPDWKLSQIVSPPVPIDNGNGTATPQQLTTTLQPWQSVGVPMDTTALRPAAPVTTAFAKATVTDPAGYVTQLEVTAMGQPLSVTDPLGNKTVYQLSGTLIHSVQLPADHDHIGGANSYYYTNGLLDSTLVAGSPAVNYRYGVYAQPDSVWGGGTVTEQRFLRADGRPDSTEYAGDTLRVAHYTYDPVTMRVATASDPGGHTTSYTYDPIFGNLQTTVTPGNRTTSLAFDAYGRDTLSQTPAVTHIIHYDAVNRPTVDSIPGIGIGTRFSYTHMTSTVTDPAGHVYRSAFNALGWVVADSSPASTTLITYRYDKRGLLTSTTNRRGQTVSSTYDPIGRVLTHTDPVSGTSQFSYSNDGMLTTASNTLLQVSTWRQRYCVQPNFVANSTCSADTTTVTYNGTPYSIGHVDPGNFADTVSTELDDPEPGAIAKHWYTRNPTLGVDDKVMLGPLSMQYYYDKTDGLRTGTDLPALHSMVDSFTTNHERYWTRYTDATVNANYQRAYHYDLAGRLDFLLRSHNGSNTSAVARSFSYDAAGRLATGTAWTEPCNGFPGGGTGTLDASQGWQTDCGGTKTVMTYQYDSVGNRRHTLTNGGSDVAGTYTVDRLQTLGSRTYQYDADGNTTHMSDASTGEARDYYYDASGLLDSVVVAGGSHPGKLSLEYDAYGRLAWRDWSSLTSPSTRRLYLYDRGNIGKELDLNNSGAATDYAFDGTDHPIMRVAHDANGNVTSTTTYLYDEIGRVIGGITTSGGTTAAVPIINYDDWGKWTSTANNPSTLRFGFKGMLYDEDVDLYYARNRWYDPNAGRFTQEDPIGLVGGINPYLFTGDDPINGTDPSGLASAADDPCIDAGGHYKEGICVGPDGGGGSWLKPVTITATVWFSASDAAGVLQQLADDRPMLNGSVAEFAGLSVIGGIAGATASGFFAPTIARVAIPASPAGAKIALGLRDVLDEFAAEHGAQTWRVWGGDDWRLGFMDAMANPRTRVVFTLDGVDNPFTAAMRGAANMGGATDWELHQIYSNPQWWGRVTWYSGGKSVPNPFGP